ncbi:MFS transporter [Escherichia coli]
MAIGLVDRWGRKPTLTLGFLLWLLAWAQRYNDGYRYSLSVGAVFAIAMLLMFIVGFAMSAGPLIWVLCSEILSC